MGKTLFTPLNISTVDTSSFGVTEPLIEKGLRPSNTNSSGLTLDSIIIIIVSAIIFVTAIAIYDVIRMSVSNHFSTRSLLNPFSRNKDEDIDRSLISNEESLYAAITFASICVITMIIAIVALRVFYL